MASVLCSTLFHAGLGEDRPSRKERIVVDAHDGHGSTRGLIDATGQPLDGQIYAYDAFGNRLSGTGLVGGTRRHSSTTAHGGSLRRLATFFGCCPSQLSLEQLRQYQVHLAQRKDISVSYYNSTVTALRFMYLETLGRDWSIERLPYDRREHRLEALLASNRRRL